MDSADSTGNSASQQATGEQFLACQEELRRIAQRELRDCPTGPTLRVTALVQEYALLLLQKGQFDRVQALGLATELMRGIIKDYWRRKLASKRGADWKRIPLVPGVDVEMPRDFEQLDYLAFEEAVTKLEREYPRPAQVFKLRFYAGLTEKQLATVLGLAESTLSADWALARMLLFKFINETP